MSDKEILEKCVDVEKSSFLNRKERDDGHVYKY